MMGDLKIAFDFINSKECVSKFTADEFTDIDKLPENLKDKKFYIFKNCEPHCQAIGTFLLDFMNTDFDDFEDFSLLLDKYLFIPLLFFYNPNILNDCLYGRNVISKKEYLKENILILSEEEFMYYWKLFYEEYNWDLSTTQLKFENIFENQYYKKFLEVTNVMDDNYDLFEEFSSKEDHFSAIKDIAPEFTTIQMSYDVKDFCDNTNIYNYFSAKNPIDIAYVSARELLNNKKSFRLVRYGICNYYFIPKTSHTPLYCDEIYQDGKTCKEYAKLISTTKTYESDPLCKKYRNRYKNLHKQASLSNNPKVSLLCEEYKLKGPKMLEKYQLGKITPEEFENWIDGMKIRKS